MPAHHLPSGSGCSGKLHKETWDVLTIHGNRHGLETGGFDKFPTISIEKWLELVIGTIQTILGLTVNTNLMTVGITPKYRQQVFNLITEKWPDTRQIFKVRDIHKLVGKVARLGKGAPWIYKIMSHVYTSLAYALKQNKLLLKECSPKFRDIVSRIERKQFSGNHREFVKELNFALKMASKMVTATHKSIS